MVESRDVFPMLNVLNRKNQSMNMCEYFDKPADNYDVRNTFKIYYYPDE